MSGFAVRLRDAAAQGLPVALAFSTLECVSLAAGARLAAGLGPTPLQPAFLGLWWVAAAALGAAGGAALGLATGLAGGRLRAALVVVAVGLHASLTVAASSPDRRLWLALTGCLLAVAAPLWRVSRPSALPGFLAAAASPWAAAPAVVVPAALVFEILRRAPLATQLAAVAGSWLAIALGIALASRWSRSLPSRPWPSVVAASAAFLAVGWLQGAAPPALPQRADSASLSSLPPVVLVTLDTVRSDHLSVYGYGRRTSPQLEAFARSATLYTRALASGDLTLTTHASIFTGLYARQHGARVDSRRGALAMREGVRTLPALLRAAGYTTLAVVANPSYLAGRFGFSRGFDHYDDRAPTPLLPTPRPHTAIAGGVALARRLLPQDRRFEHADSSYRRAGRINREVFGLLDGLAREPRPFLLFVNYMDAHWPYDPPRPFRDRFPGGLGRGAPGLQDFQDVAQQRRRYTPVERRHLVSRYDGAIAYVDHELGRLFERLRELGLWEASLVIVTSDHGEAFGEHGLAGHGVSLHEHQIHVPLLIKAPGQQQAAVVERPVSSVDLLPTILHVVGLERPGGLPGVSLSEGAPPLRPIFSESYANPGLYRAHPRFRRDLRAVLLGDWKLVVSSRGRRRLFHLGEDPGELADLSASGAPLGELEAQLQDWLDDAPERTGREVSLDEEARRLLRELGYGS